ncbi:mRNA deadenylase subunit [Pseudoloma neurophilia]|uniref:poly(A)-specific ribonuclease n=1 Tax=Pseudoloma neurophilia TaxID=146866 RepID=A0A0R0M160_9MICR|nr:mRNA deadenylase subunit [Pseudoloma neurophilia]
MGKNIVDVWEYNLDEAFADMRKLGRKYKYIAMDTEFPGVVAKPVGYFSSHSTYVYQQLLCNVDMLKIIQLGVTFSDENGNSPERGTFQFNFKFNLDKDMYARESINLLREAQLDFEKHKMYGISTKEFALLMITSGLIFSDEIIWLSFHSSYDFAYLSKVLFNSCLPKSPIDFLNNLEILFPNFFDVKFLLRKTSMVKKGLQEIADEFGLKRIGIQHQAGSDSILTRDVFFRAKTLYFTNDDLAEQSAKLFGIEKRGSDDSSFDFS